ncbi:CCA tRNA nucleotidyltransferase, mitochondrial [Orbilia blumenaviensis]|uniref:CCA tRNA nucleotidyltransferase, mitochondrial n=1 Tax=Orbilia blumenaviensis TaxID=1796055 RepID=A0AAV9VN53_9PEZI
MIRPCAFNCRLRLSLLQRPPTSESPHHHRQFCAIVINRRISTLPRQSSSPTSRSIYHSHCRTRLLSLLPTPRLAQFSTTASTQAKKKKMATQPLPTITLTPEEEKVRSLLVDVASSIDSTAAQSEPTVLRITGGWVRDKLLNGKSHDIDVGINNMTGFEFASHLNGFLTSNVEKYGIPAKSIHKIESNPEKSKHLETATTKILGLDIDFVNLRSESYSEESRIPKMEFGTPKEDALRRDACVNALFYNLMTQQVEDFTERGLSDLKARILRTPLPPLQTFKDDPLRVLRLIRFASRLDFTIDPKSEQAMQNPEIKAALKLKISRERVGVEVEKMLYGERPYEALDLIERLGLVDAVFDVPKMTEEQLEEVKYEYARLGIDGVKWLFGGFQNVNGCDGVKKLASTERDRYLMWLFAATLPWSRVIVAVGDKKKIRIAAGVAAARDGLKLSNKDTDSLDKMVKSYRQVKATISNFGALSRSILGKYIRLLGAEWRVYILASLLIEMVEARSSLEHEEFGSQQDLELIARYESFLDRIYSEDLGEAWDLKYLLTGNELKDAMGKKPGKWMAAALEQVMEWQLDNPQATKEEALENIKEIVVLENYH